MKSPWLLLVLVLAPAIFWIGYYYYHDRYKPEPLVLTAFSFLLGFIAAWACLRFNELLPIFGSASEPLEQHHFTLPFLGYCLFPVGLLEEACKLLPFLLIIRFSDFDEEVDGIFYSSAIALGFASYENLSYLPTLSGFFLIGRAFASPLTHTIFASIWGYRVGMARIQKKALWPAIGVGLSMAALGHGLYDFFAFSPVLRLISAALVLAIWLWLIGTSERLIKKDAAASRPQP